MKSSFDPQCITYSQMNLIFNSRLFFRRLVTWTRAYLISRYLGIGTTDELFGRVYLEALDFGNMLNILFGRELANQAGEFASSYTIGLRDLISAQLEGDTEAINIHLAELYQNVKDSIAFITEINPYWNKDKLTELLNRFIQYTIEEANALVTGNYAGEAEPYLRFTALIEELGDFMAQGLFEYMTSGLMYTPAAPFQCGQCITKDQLNALYRFKMFWYELVSMVRNYMLSRYMRLGSQAEEFFYNVIKKLALDFGNALREFFGDKAADDFILLLETYSELINALITAQMEGNENEIRRIMQLLNQNAEEIAAFLASINPFWDYTVWKNTFDINVRNTIYESTTFITEDFIRNLDIFNTLLGQAENAGNYFLQGLLEYLEKQCRESLAGFYPQSPLA